MRLGLPEILLIGVIALVIFGPSRLPELGKAFGKAIREFKQSVRPSEGGEAGKSSPPAQEK